MPLREIRGFMGQKQIETLAALLVIVTVPLLALLLFHTQAEHSWSSAVRGTAFEDIDDIAPGPANAKAEVEAQYWISSDDYPLEAMRNEWQGTSAIEWTIDRHGRAVDCHTTSSSGYKVLDDAACNAITSNARYIPARDAQGRRIEMTSRRRVVWRLPE